MQRFLAFLFLMSSLAGCGQKVEATPTLETVVPYQTMAATRTFTIIPALTGIILPTPTTFTYSVVQGDTLSSIAQRNGVSLAALQAANPGVSSTVLSVGTKLVIPTGDQTPAEPAPTPAAMPVRQAHCWPEVTGGLWCFALLQNDYADALENISAQFALLDSSGQELTNQIAYALLDILPPGASMPLAIYFAPPLQGYGNLRVQVLTATRLLPADTRYLPVRLENTLVSLDSSGRTAAVSGRVVLTGSGTANTLWILAIAYDVAGELVGLRRWESTSALTADGPALFNFQIYTVGPGIAKVEFLAEARP